VKRPEELVKKKLKLLGVAWRTGKKFRSENRGLRDLEKNS
jgi:hypothetical protein